MATVTITSGGTTASVAFASVTITDARVNATAPATVTLTEAGVQGVTTGALVNITKASWLGATAGASVTLTEAFVIGDGMQGPGAPTVLRYIRDNNLWKQVVARNIRQAGAWVPVSSAPIVPVTPPTGGATTAKVSIVQASAIGRIATAPPPSGWNPNTGPMQRLDRGFDDRLPGVPVVWYEDLYVAGDTVTQALARLTTQAVVSFPEGRFEQRDFRTVGFRSIDIPSQCRGLWGSGRGSVGSSTGTIFSIVPNSSTRQADVPPQDNSTPVQMRVMYHGGAVNPDLHYAQFRVEGTDQGHIYHNFTVYNPVGKVTMHDVLSNGHYGNNGAPPGETFGIEIHGSGNNLTNPVIYDCECDGRRAIGGPNYGAVGFDIANCVQGSWTNCYSHHTVASSFVIFQSFNITSTDIRLGDPADTDGTGVDGFNYGGWINHERTANCVHTRPKIFRVFKNRGKTVHITHSNDTYVQGGYSTANGQLKIIDPTFNDIWGDGKLYVQSWHPYWTGCSMDGAGKTGIPATPFAVQADGVTPLALYKYVHTFTPVAGQHTFS